MWDCQNIQVSLQVSNLLCNRITRYPYRFLRLNTTIIYASVRRVVVVGLGQLIRRSCLTWFASFLWFFCIFVLLLMYPFGHSLYKFALAGISFRNYITIYYTVLPTSIILV
jgi:hypothetical protein